MHSLVGAPALLTTTMLHQAEIIDTLNSGWITTGPTAAWTPGGGLISWSRPSGFSAGGGPPESFGSARWLGEHSISAAAVG